jgi:hypothetical protein
MSTSKVPDLTMTHADSLHYQPTQGCGNFVYKILVLGHQKAQVEQIHVCNIDKDFMVHELTPVLHRRSTDPPSFGHATKGHCPGLVTR